MSNLLVSVGLCVAAALVAVGQTPPQNAVSQAAPPVDCTVYPAARTSLYILPYEVGQAYEVWRTTAHYSPGNRGVGL